MTHITFDLILLTLFLLGVTTYAAARNVLLLAIANAATLPLGLLPKYAITGIVVRLGVTVLSMPSRSLLLRLKVTGLTRRPTCPQRRKHLRDRP